MTAMEWKEAISKTKPDTYEIVTVECKITAVVKARVPMDKILEAQQSLRAKINAVLPSLDVGPLGRTCTLWRPPTNDLLYMEPDVIVSHAFNPIGEVVSSALLAGRAAHFLLRGPYERLIDAWSALFEWCVEERLELADVNWEIYGNWNDDPSKLETALYALLI